MPDWDALIAAALDQPLVLAHTFVKAWGTASRPVLLECDDNNDYVVKGRQAGRMPVNDQIVARVAEAAAAPTGVPALVDVPGMLIAAQPEMQHLPAGVAHGTKWIPDCSERAAIDHTSEAENRPRFTALALLFGWIEANDQQFIYTNASPHRVYSVDHGHFFPGGPNWTVATLAAAATPVPSPDLVTNCGLTTAELDAAKPPFAAVTDETIAAAVAAPPDDWGLAWEERLAVAEFLASRRDVICV